MLASHSTAIRTLTVTVIPLPDRQSESLAGMQLSGDALRSLVTPSLDEIRVARRTLHRKAVAILTALCVGYATLLNGDALPLVRVVAYFVVLLALAMVATSIMHDANHGAFFDGSMRANHAVGYLADLLGVSSSLWRIKHNIHHAETNVQGLDPDIDQGVVARLAPLQTAKPWHRWQHRYMWALYGFMGVQWLLVSDFVDLARGQVAGQSITRLGMKTRAGIFAGKLLHVAWALALPLVWFPWQAVIPAYLVGSWLIGSVLAITFQIAHCVDVAEFAQANSDRPCNDAVWHQLRTTVDVVQRNTPAGRFRSMMVGGLDLQIEHHLAPHVPHTAYRAMEKRLRSAGEEHGISFLTHSGVLGAMRSHQRWLRQMGRP